MIARRKLLLSGLAAPLAAMAPVPQQIAFRVVRKDSDIGTHVLRFTSQDDGFDASIAVDIAVRFGPIVLYRYTLRGQEEWRGGKVARVTAETDDDGTQEEMRADRDAQGLWVSGSKATRYLAPTNALPATHWNMAELDGPWINPQNGKLLRPQVTPRGTTPVQLSDGRTIDAAEYALSGDADLDMWYDAQRRWTALRFKASDGSAVRYELMV